MLVLPDSVTMREARDTLRLLAQAMKSESEAGVAIDASPLRQLDTSAIAVLLECRRLAQGDGKVFEVRNAPGKLSALAALYGVDSLVLPAAPSAA